MEKWNGASVFPFRMVTIRWVMESSAFASPGPSVWLAKLNSALLVLSPSTHSHVVNVPRTPTVTPLQCVGV